MKNYKRLLSLLLIAVMTFSFAGCQEIVEDYDVSGYIRSVLNCVYKGEPEDYIAFTGSTEDAAAETHAATVSNAAIRFCEKYSMNADEEQMAKIEEIMSKALAASNYTVHEKTEASYGYDVLVEYQVQTTFQMIGDDIQALCDKAFEENTRTNVGAAHINDIIDLCLKALENPTYGETVTVNFDIIIDDNYYLSLNVDLYDDIDNSILVF